MSKERALLRRLVDSYWQIGTSSVGIHAEVEELLAQPDIDIKEFQRGYMAALSAAVYMKESKREPLSKERLTQLYAINVLNDPFIFARQVEMAHGIGVDDNG